IFKHHRQKNVQTQPTPRQRLARTRGLWTQIDGLAWQVQLREEWAERGGKPEMPASRPSGGGVSG
ncbi:hypothetical protein RM532_13830, partial [Salinisphaera sp. W335]